ncbi:MAG: hypothetical protein FWC27_15510 [Firmicutes bacterium]|nr:hypothetical protein [Bacillota bacterium]
MSLIVNSDLTERNCYVYGNMKRSQKRLLKLLGSVDQNFLSFLVGLIAAIGVEQLLDTFRLNIAEDLVLFISQVIVSIIWCSTCIVSASFLAIFISVQNNYNDDAHANDEISKVNRFLENYQRERYEFNRLHKRCWELSITLLLSILAMLINFFIANL